MELTGAEKMEVDIGAAADGVSYAGLPIERISPAATDVVKESFKYFKRRKPPPDFSRIIDFDKASISQDPSSNVQPYVLNAPESDVDFSPYGVKNPSNWMAFTLKSHPGLIFIRDPFTCEGQLQWASRSLCDLAQAPNRTNLDQQGLLPAGANWWDLCHRGRDRQQLKKLRWVTLGFHHDWNSKVYNVCQSSPFPADISGLASLVAASVGYPRFSAEAAIINFYQPDSTLAPHTDHSEWDMQAPLLSLSFGQTAIFLLGGVDRSEPVAAMFVRSGDVIVMADRCRLSYHGVARVLPAADNRWQCGKRKRPDDPLSSESTVSKQARRHSTDHAPCHRTSQSGHIACECDVSDDVTDEADRVAEYLRHSRVNLNIRQVFPHGVMLRPAQVT